MKFNIKCLYIFIIYLLSIFEASSQTIAVKSFRKLETDQEARIVSPKTDQNGKKCAIIKVVTSQSGFVFDFGLIGNAVATLQKTGEIWVWVPSGARKVTINHQQLGVLRNYPFETDIEEATVYEMVITTGKVEIIVKEDQIALQWLVINSTPSGADLYIDDQPANQTPYQRELPLGKHTYRLSHDMYLPTAGTVILNTDQKEVINSVLNPDFGKLNISTSPENGAAVSIDGQPTGKFTPCTLEQLKSGEHTVTLRLNMYKTATEKITMQAGGDVSLPLTLTPTFSVVTVNTNPASEIYISGELKGNGSWTGRLLPGFYLFEVRKDKYTSVSEKHEVITGQALNLTFQPIAKNGILKVISTPNDATILFDGANKGTTPATLRNLLIGDYTLSLSLPGYATINKTITITEGQTTEVNETLLIGREVIINSIPIGTELLIDGVLVGKTPYNGSLTFGSHTLSIIQNGNSAKKTITVEQTGGESSFILDFGPQSFIETVNRVRIEMVGVKGGIFQMGNNNEVANEKPEHSVMVSDFSIGKYEVTQSQWQAIMGSNPSKFKGENFPVEQVSWNDVQEFIKRLNAKTRKTYRLPTEAEWEYAAGSPISIATDRTKYAGPRIENSLSQFAWYRENSDSTTHEVGTKQPNGLGLYDMSGNVWEWCYDIYDKYPSTDQINPKTPSSGSSRVLRGGSWLSYANGCRVSFRNYSATDDRGDDLGFRLVLSN